MVDLRLHVATTSGGPNTVLIVSRPDTNTALLCVVDPVGLNTRVTRTDKEVGGLPKKE